MQTERGLESILQAVLVFLHISAATNDNIQLDNVYCDLYPDYISTDPKFPVYLPFVVKLFRCHGSVGLLPPSVKRCVAQNATEIPVITQNVLTHQYKINRLLNHTSCMGQCTQDASSCNKHQVWDESNCECQCKYKRRKSLSTTRNICCSPKVWSQLYCNCVCPTRPKLCSSRKEWSDEECGCVCQQKYFHQCSGKNTTIEKNSCLCKPKTAGRTAECSKRGIISMDVVALVMVAEALLMAFCYVVYRIVYHKIQDDIGETSSRTAASGSSNNEAKIESVKT